MGDSLALLIHIESDDHDPLLARWLRTELFGLDIDQIEPVRDETDRPGARAVTALLVSLGPTALEPVTSKIRGWCAHNHRTVDLTLDGDTLKITGTPTEPEEQLVAAWLAKHATGS
jgi:hypothetical protein